MKKIVVLAFISLLLLPIVFAEEELPSPGLLPDHPLYPFKTFFEKVRLWLTFDPEARARFHSWLAEQRLAELKAMVEKGRPEYVERLRGEYENEMRGAEAETNRSNALGRNITDLVQHISKRTRFHLRVLQDVYEKVPEEAKPAIERAMDVSLRGHKVVAKIIARRMPALAARINTEFAEEGISIVKRLFKRKRIGLAKKILEEYIKSLEETNETVESVEKAGKNITEIALRVCNMTYKHIYVLQDVLEEVPEEAKPAIERAMDVSLRGHEKCVERLSKIINKSVERFKDRVCREDADCLDIPLHCRFLNWEPTCFIPPNKTIGFCKCIPKWRKVFLSCAVDADCRNLVCPTVIGHDTPLCKEGKCVCGARWEILNKTEWKERFKKEFKEGVIKKIKEIREEVLKEKKVEPLKELMEKGFERTR